MKKLGSSGQRISTALGSSRQRITMVRGGSPKDVVRKGSKLLIPSESAIDVVTFVFFILLYVGFAVPMIVSVLD